MVKKFVKSILTLALLLSVPQFSLRSETSAVEMIDIDSYLQPQDLALMEQDEPMVYMSPDFVELMKNFSSNDQEVMDLVDHVKMGYTVAPMKDVSVAVDHAMKSSNLKSNDFTILRQYQSALLNGDALIRSEEESLSGRKKLRKKLSSCTLLVKNCASIGCLNVRTNASVCGNLNVGGTISACNFAFGGTGCTGYTGCTAVSTFPGISSCGNVVFNTGGMNTLNAQGAFEAMLRLLRGTVTLTPAAAPGIVIGSTGPGTAITVTGTPSATISTANDGLATSGTVTGVGFSSGIPGVTTASTTTATEFYFAVNLQIPITYSKAYSTVPSVLTGLQTTNTIVGTTPVTDGNTATTISVSISNVTTAGATINLVFNVNAYGADYPTALGFAATAINNILAAGVALNIYADGPVV